MCVWRGQVSKLELSSFSLSVAVSSPLRGSVVELLYIPGCLCAETPTPDAGVLLRGPTGRERDPTLWPCHAP